MALLCILLTRVFAFHFAYFPVDFEESFRSDVCVSHLPGVTQGTAILAKRWLGEVQLLSGVLLFFYSTIRTDRQLTCGYGGPAHLQIAAVISVFKVRSQAHLVVHT